MNSRQGKIHRRAFLRGTTAATMAMAFTTTKSLAQRGANERINVAVIGVGNMGFDGHVKNLLKLRDDGMVNIAAVCDVWDKRLARAQKALGLDIKQTQIPA